MHYRYEDEYLPVNKKQHAEKKRDQSGKNRKSPAENKQHETYGNYREF